MTDNQEQMGEKVKYWKVVEDFVGGEFPEKKAKVLMDAISILQDQSFQRGEASGIRRAMEGVRKADSYLSLLRHRCESVIPWGTPGMPSQMEVDSTIGQLRSLLAQGKDGEV